MKKEALKRRQKKMEMKNLEENMNENFQNEAFNNERLETKEEFFFKCQNIFYYEYNRKLYRMMKEIHTY